MSNKERELKKEVREAKSHLKKTFMSYMRDDELGEEVKQSLADAVSDYETAKGKLAKFEAAVSNI